MGVVTRKFGAEKRKLRAEAPSATICALDLRGSEPQRLPCSSPEQALLER